MTRPRIVALVAALAVALAGCVNDARRPSTSTAASVPATAPASATTRPVATTTTTTEPPTPVVVTPTTTTSAVDLGPITLLEAGPGQPLLVGGMFPFFGPAGDSGAAQADAVQLAVERFGDIAGHDVLLAPFEDSRCTVDGGRSAARSIVSAGPAIAGGPVVGILGPACDAAYIEGVPLLVEAGFTVVSPTVADPSFTSDLQGEAGSLHVDGFFTVAPNEVRLGAAAARFAASHLGVTRPAVVVMQDRTGLGDLFAKSMSQAGSPVVGTAVLPADLGGVRGLLRALIDLEPDVVFIALDPDDASTVLGVLRGIPALADAVRLVPGPPSDSVGDAADEVVATYYVANDEEPGGRDATGSRYRDVYEAYERAFGRPPTFEAMRAYDATMLLLTAVSEVAEDRSGTLVIDRRALVAAMGDVGVRSFFGWLACDPFGDCLEGRVNAFAEAASLGETLADVVWSEG